MSDSNDIAVRDVHDIIGCVAHFYKKRKSVKERNTNERRKDKRSSNKEEIMQFIEQANKHHPTIKFTAEISDTERTFLDPNAGIHKDERFNSGLGSYVG